MISCAEKRVRSIHIHKGLKVCKWGEGWLTYPVHESATSGCSAVTRYAFCWIVFKGKLIIIAKLFSTNNVSLCIDNNPSILAGCDDLCVAVWTTACIDIPCNIAQHCSITDRGSINSKHVVIHLDIFVFTLAFVCNCIADEFSSILDDHITSIYRLLCEYPPTVNFAFIEAEMLRPITACQPVNLWIAQRSQTLEHAALAGTGSSATKSSLLLAFANFDCPRTSLFSEEWLFVRLNMASFILEEPQSFLLSRSKETSRWHSYLMACSSSSFDLSFFFAFTFFLGLAFTSEAF